MTIQLLRERRITEELSSSRFDPNFGKVLTLNLLEYLI